MEKDISMQFPTSDYRYLFTFYMALPQNIVPETCTVEPVLRDHCHGRAPVLKDQIFLAEGPTF